MKRKNIISIVMCILLLCGCVSSEVEEPSKDILKQDVQEYFKEILDIDETIEYLKVDESSLDQKEKEYEALVLVKLDDSTSEMKLEYKLIDKKWEMRGIELLNQYHEEMETKENRNTDVKVGYSDEISSQKNLIQDNEIMHDVEGEHTATVELGDDWTDYQVRIDGVVYEFPMYMSDILTLGWSFEYEDDATQLIEPNSYDIITMKKGEEEFHFYVVNFDINGLLPSECLAGGCSNWSSIEELKSIEFPGGINQNSSVEDITEIYGIPTDTYEGEYSLQLTYEKEWHEYMKFTFKDNKLNSFEIENFTKPDDFKEGVLVDEIPEQVLNYVIPKELEEDLNSTTISMDGAIYRIPFPLRELLANGWELEENGVVAGNNHGYCEITKDNQTIRVHINNYSVFANTVDNCMVTELICNSKYNGTNEFKTQDAQMAEGIYLGMDEAELLDILDNSNIKYSKESSESLNKYMWGEDTYENYKKIIVDNKSKQVYYIGISQEYEE